MRSGLVGSEGHAQFPLSHCVRHDHGRHAEHGAGSLNLQVSFVVSMVVMYDAIGVRRETGKQAKLLNPSE